MRGAAARDAGRKRARRCGRRRFLCDDDGHEKTRNRPLRSTYNTHTTHNKTADGSRGQEFSDEGRQPSKLSIGMATAIQILVNIRSKKRAILIFLGSLIVSYVYLDCLLFMTELENGQVRNSHF